MRWLRQPFNIVLVCSLGVLSSCTSNYFAAPVATPVFSAPWQGSLQTNYTTDGKLFFEAAGSLPFNLAVVASREFWGHNLENDQEMSSIALGKFWPNQNIMYLWMAGFGAGSQRLDNVRSYSPSNSDTIQFLTSRIEFRKYFIEFEFANSDIFHYNLYGSADPEVKTSLGLASRLEYLDRYQFNQTKTKWSNSQAGLPTDSTITLDNLPKHSFGLDFAFFATSGISFVHFYGQLVLSLPLSGYHELWDWLVATAGLRLSF